ncbi:MAG TPA: hypothetical protein VFG21_05765 [Xanthomonadaceae bacterium]|nr:hypothetical protein [Xanthomonadaceae bacterium]
MVQGQIRPGVRRSRSAITGVARIAGSGAEVPILDLSLSGVRLGRPTGFGAAEGSVHGIELSVEGGPAVAVTAELVRAGTDELAFRFGHLSYREAESLAAARERYGQPHDRIDEDG